MTRTLVTPKSKPLVARILLSLRRIGLWAVQLWVPLAMLTLLPTAANFLGNRFEVSYQDLLVPVVVDILLALVIAVAYTWLWRRNRLRGYVVAVLTAIILGGNYNGRLNAVYAWLNSHLGLPEPSGWWYEQIINVVGLVLVVGICYGLGRGIAWLAHKLHWPEREVMVTLTIAIAATFLLKAVPVVTDVAAEWPQFFYRPPQLTTVPAAAKTGDKPDIFYIILDRYASQSVIQQQLGFDNSDFINYLNTNGYYVNPLGHNNYPYTATSVASTMTGNYLNDIVQKFGKSSQQTTIPFNETIRNSPVAAELQSIGYRYDLIGNWYETSNTSRIANTIYSQTGRLSFWGKDYIIDNFPKNILTQSVLWRFVQGGVHLGSFTLFNYQNMNDIDMNQYALNQLKAEASSSSTGGRFIFAHILIPHDPYYYNADGSLNANPNSNNSGEGIKQKYAGQVSFINNQMKGILSDINTQSNGKSVVVLQSDEGPYPFQLNDQDFDQSNIDTELQDGDMRKWTDQNLLMKFGNLTAYHVPAATGLTPAADTTGGADPVNIFRLISNSYFGTTLPMLPRCYYVYPNGRDQPERFTGITERILGQPADAKCQDNGSVGP